MQSGPPPPSSRNTPPAPSPRRRFCELAAFVTAGVAIGIGLGIGITMRIIRVHNTANFGPETNATATPVQPSLSTAASFPVSSPFVINNTDSSVSCILGSSEFRNLSRFFIGLGLSLVALAAIIIFVSGRCQRGDREGGARVHFGSERHLLRMAPGEDEDEESITVEVRPESPEESEDDGTGDSASLLQKRR